MFTRMLAVVACVCGVALGGQVVTVNGVRLDLKRKMDIAAPVVIQDLAVHECAVAATKEPVVLVSGYVVTHVKDNLYTVRLQFDLWFSMPTSDGGVKSTATAMVQNPVPQKRHRFIVVVPLAGYGQVPGGTVGVTATYSLERTSAVPALNGKQMPQ